MRKGRAVLLTLDVTTEDDVSLALTEAEVESICEMVLAEEGVDRPCFLSLSVVSDATMREHNLSWRGVDAATDVISLECERPDDPDLAAGEPCELGDIFLAPDYLARQARGFGTTEADETRLMLIHGMLHLLGYDHLEEDEALVMEGREDELLALVSTDATLGNVTLTRHREGDDA